MFYYSDDTFTVDNTITSFTPGVNITLTTPFGEKSFKIQDDLINVVQNANGQVFLGSGTELCAVTKTQNDKIEKLKELINEMDETSLFNKMLKKEMEKLIEKAETL